MYNGQFWPTSWLKLRFVLFKAERVSDAAGISNPRQVATFSGLKRDKPQFSFRRKLTIVHNKKIESNKKLIFEKKICFPKFPLFNHLTSFDLNFLEKGLAKYFKNGLKSFHILHLSICIAYLFWVRTLIQIASPDSSEAR